MRCTVPWASPCLPGGSRSGPMRNRTLTVSIGRLRDDASVGEARAFCAIMDAELERVRGQKVRRSLFK